MIDNYELVYTSTNKKNNPSSKKSTSSQKPQMRLEKKGRGGKSVTVIANLKLSDDDLKKLCKLIKSKCGTGGTVKAHHIEIQGDFREIIRPMLLEQGHKVSG